MAGKRAASTQAKERAASRFQTCEQCSDRFFSGNTARERALCGACQPIDGSAYRRNGDGSFTWITNPWHEIPRPQQALDRAAAMLEQSATEPVTELGYAGKAAPLRDGTQAWGGQRQPPSVIRLTDAQVRQAVLVGEARCREALRKHRKELHGFKGDPWEIHREGACGELAVAVALGVRWNASVNTFHGKPDVAGYEVKTRSSEWYDLIVRKDTDPREAFILVTGRRPEYRVVGWIDGKAARSPAYWAEHGARPGAWFVPQRVLQPMSSAPIPWPAA